MIFGVSVGAVSTVVGVNTVGVGVVGFNTTVGAVSTVLGVSIVVFSCACAD